MTESELEIHVYSKGNVYCLFTTCATGDNKVGLNVQV